MLRIATILACLAGLLVPAVPLRGGIEPTREQAVKAAFIYNFILFVEWPSRAFAGDTSPLLVAAVCDDGSAAALDKALAGKALRGHPVRLRRCVSVREIPAGCHVLVLDTDDAEVIRSARRRLDGAPVLLIGEGERFCARGGMICLFAEKGHIRFEINPEAVTRAGLKVAAKLLRLATIYGKGE